MNNDEAIRSTLAQLVRLLREQGVQSWADALSRHTATLKQTPHAGLDELLRCYGGSGSFNDLVLSGVPVSVNEQLDQLRQRLFEQAVAMRVALSPDVGKDCGHAP